MVTTKKNIFAGDDPFEIARRWYFEASETELNDPDAVALATIDGRGLPNVRMVLMRFILDDAFVFFTNYESVKSAEILSSGKAAFVYHWKSLRRQIRVRGEVSKEDLNLSDKYFGERSKQSRYGAWASMQSEPLSDKNVLFERIEKFKVELGNNPPRPDFWGGFKLIPTEIEFWADGKYRLHDRFRWSRLDISKEWEVNRLYP